MLRKTLVAIIAVGAILLFVGLLLYAMSLTISGTPNEMPPVAIGIISSVNAILVANLGTVLGIGLSSAGGFHRMFAEKFTLAQLLAAIVYVVVLVVVLGFWASQGFEEDTEIVVKSIPEIGRTGLGIFIVVLGSLLGAEGIRAAFRTS